MPRVQRRRGAGSFHPGTTPAKRRVDAADSGAACRPGRMIVDPHLAAARPTLALLIDPDERVATVRPLRRVRFIFRAQVSSRAEMIDRMAASMSAAWMADDRPSAGGLSCYANSRSARWRLPLPDLSSSLRCAHKRPLPRGCDASGTAALGPGHRDTYGPRQVSAAWDHRRRHRRTDGRDHQCDQRRGRTKYLPSIVVRKRHIGDVQAPIQTRTSGLGKARAASSTRTACCSRR